MGMKWIGKVAGGLLGGLVLGPIGAAFGVLLGHQFDEISGEAEEPTAAEELATGVGQKGAVGIVIGVLLTSRRHRTAEAGG